MECIEMKEWTKPVLEEIDIKDTSCNNYWVDTNNESYVEYDEDLGRCHNPYWQGNGRSEQEVHDQNPFWAGGWGN